MAGNAHKETALRRVRELASQLNRAMAEYEWRLKDLQNANRRWSTTDAAL